MRTGWQKDVAEPGSRPGGLPPVQPSADAKLIAAGLAMVAQELARIANALERR